MRFKYIEVLNCGRPPSSKIISGLFWIVILVFFLLGNLLINFCLYLVPSMASRVPSHGSPWKA